MERLFHPRDGRAPLAQIVSRRHPLAMAQYTMVFMFGVIFMFQWFGSGQRTEDVFPDIPWVVIFAWKWEMILGGGIALTALLVKPRPNPHWPDLADILRIEGIGAVVGAFGLMTYLVGVVTEMGPSQAGPAMAVFLPLVGGHFVRGYQAYKEARTLVALMAALEEHGRD